MSKFERNSDCMKCPPMLAAAEMILKDSICTLSNVFKTFFPDTTYHSHQAKRRLLQMPLTTIRVGSPSDGNSTVYIMEFFQGIDYSNLRRILQSNKSPTPSLTINKKEVHELLLLTSTDRERDIKICNFQSFWADSNCSSQGTRI